MKVAVIGLGYIGLPTAAILASRKIHVTGVDIDEKVVQTINQGAVHIAEPNLEHVVKTAIATGYLSAATEPSKADVFLITVPTPFKKSYEPDLSFIKDAAYAIAPYLQKGNLIILESTVPVGATEKMMQWLKESRHDIDFKNPDIFIAHCPERVLPGCILHELVKNNRIIGGVTSLCARHALEFYKLFVEGQCVLTDVRTAELCKLVENSFRDVNIAFANELSYICDKLDINVWELISLANQHPRVNILKPGPGVGGHCIAVDPWFIVNSAPNESNLIRTARLVNNAKPDFILSKISRLLNDLGKLPTEIKIACLGLAFKANVGDLRESPALEIAVKIAQMGFKQQYIVEPYINNLPRLLIHPEISLISLEEGVKSADLIILLVDHWEFKAIDLGWLSGKQIIDTRGIWSTKEVTEQVEYAV